MRDYGVYKRPVLIFEQYLDFAEKLELEEAEMRADFPGFLWGPVRRNLWFGYSLIEPQYRRYARVENVPDFRPQSMYALGRYRGFGFVGEGGEYPGGRRTEFGGPTLAVDTYGAIHSITRHAIINDQTGQLLNRLPREMGEEAAEFVAESIVALIESNPTAWDGNPYYSVGRGNQTTAALSEDSLVDAMTFMEQQRDNDNRRIRIRPRWLVVQNPRQELIARRIINSTVTGTSVNWTGGTAGVGTDKFDKGTLNPLEGLMPGDAIIREPYYNDANDWYLFADVNDVPAFAVGFLNGMERPAVFLKDPGVRNALGPGTDPYTWEGDEIAFKVRHDFGTSTVDPRGTYRGLVP